MESLFVLLMVGVLVFGSPKDTTPIDAELSQGAAAQSEQVETIRVICKNPLSGKITRDLSDYEGAIREP